MSGQTEGLTPELAARIARARSMVEAWEQGSISSSREGAERLRADFENLRVCLSAASRRAQPDTTAPWRWAIEYAPNGDREHSEVLSDALYLTQHLAELECARRQALYPNDERRAVPVYLAVRRSVAADAPPTRKPDVRGGAS